jgi:hypothetical protein
LNTPNDQPNAMARVLTGTAVATIQAQFEEALADLESTLTTALANALDAGRRAQSAKALAVLVPHLEQTERDLLTKNHQLAGMAGHEDQAVFTGGIAAWREQLPPAQTAVFDAARHSATQVSAALLRYSTAAAAAPKPRKGAGKRHQRPKRR